MIYISSGSASPRRPPAGVPCFKARENCPNGSWLRVCGPVLVALFFVALFFVALFLSPCSCRPVFCRPALRALLGDALPDPIDAGVSRFKARPTS